MFGPKWDEWEWRRLHNKELYALFLSPNIIRVIKSRRIKWVGHVEIMGWRTGAYRVLFGEETWPRRRWEDNMKMGLQEVRIG